MLNQFYDWLAWKLPRRLVFYSAIRMGTQASTGTYKYKPYPEITFFEVIKDWNK